MQKGIKFLIENSLFLVAGALVGLIWANTDGEGYRHFAHGMHFAVNDVAMAFFFLLAGKEIRESMLPCGSLASVKTAALPIMATIGGMAGPALVYLLGVWYFNHPELTRGWAIPMATDIAFSYLVARMIWPKGHPAIVFLLLLAIADDAGGLIVLATAYPQESGNLMYLFTLAPMAIGLALVMWKKFCVTSFWAYLLVPGPILWTGFYLGGIHPALALVPLAWCMPHAHSDMGIWAPGESMQKDTLNRMEHRWKAPVEIILGFFGFVNAGVEFSVIDNGTYLVLSGLLIGKPLGIYVMGRLGQKFGLTLPTGMHNRDLAVLGFAAAIGFTVALFVSVAAFPPGTLQDACKMGALMSFSAAVLTFLAARLMDVGRFGKRVPLRAMPGAVRE